MRKIALFAVAAAALIAALLYRDNLSDFRLVRAQIPAA